MLSFLNPLSYVFSGLGAATYRLPEYKDTPDNFTYYRGERAILQCSVKYLGTKQVGRSLHLFLCTVDPIVSKTCIFIWTISTKYR